MAFLIAIIAIAIIALAIQYLVANEFYQAAKDKGYNSEKYLWISFLLGIPGYLLVIALPNRTNTKFLALSASKNMLQNDELPEI